MAGIRALHKQKWGFNLKTLESHRETEQRIVQSDKFSMTLYHIKECGIERGKAESRQPATASQLGNYGGLNWAEKMQGTRVPGYLEEQPKRRFLLEIREGRVASTGSEVSVSPSKKPPHAYMTANSPSTGFRGQAALDLQCLLSLALDSFYINIWSLLCIVPDIYFASGGVLGTQRSMIPDQPMSAFIGITSGDAGATRGKETVRLG